MATINRSMSYGQTDLFGKFIITGTDAKRKTELESSFGRRKYICDYLEDNFSSTVEVVKTRQNDVNLVNYDAKDLANLLEDSEISLTRKGIRYLKDNTNIDGTINRERFCIAIELYGDISKLEGYCRNPTSK